MDKCFIVVWMNEDESDHFEVFESYSEAVQRYKQLLEADETSIASVCVPLESTDYATVNRKSLVWPRI